MNLSKKLIIEEPFFDLVPIYEEQNLNVPKKLHLKGPVMQWGIQNKNRREYLEEEMEKEANRWISEHIKGGHAMGELEHPESANVDLNKVSHRFTSLEKNGNYYIGNAVILDTPKGHILKGLVEGGCKIGMSTRALGTLEQKESKNVVKNFNLIAIDAVHTPSMKTAWVDGILESKSFVCSKDGSYEEVYEKFEKSIKKYPAKDQESIREHFIKTFKAFMSGF